MKRISSFSPRLLLSAAILLMAAASPLIAADSDKEQKLIAIIKSDAPPQDKAIPCKELAIYGTKNAVPALAALLPNPDLSSWARIALQAIPGPEADSALRDAVPKLQGKLLIGTMNTIGIRGDRKAVDVITPKLADPDMAVVAAAAAALGNIGGNDAAQHLKKAMARKDAQNAVSEGVILCAERFLANEKYNDATQLYDLVRNADVPTQRKLEGMRGAILARRSDGIPLLLEQLRSTDKAVLAMALRTARELPGREATDALGAELQKATPERQVMLLLALADRTDSAVFPKLLQIAEKGFKGTRVATYGLLDRYHNFDAVPVLLNGAVDEDADIARTAKATLTRMEGKQVDNALMKKLPQATGRTRQVILELAALRRIDAAVPLLLKSAEDSDPGVRRAAYTTLGTIGTEQQAADLVKLLGKTKEADDRDAIEKALTGISSRSGTKAVPAVLPLTKHSDSDVRMIALRILATAGGPEALGAVASAVSDTDESVQDEAVGTLATWPNNWPDDGAVAEPLLKVAQTGRTTSYQVQATRGYLLHLQQNKGLNTEARVKGINTLLTSVKQPSQKKLAISALGSIPSTKSLEALVPLTADPAVGEDACSAIVTVATAKNQAGINKEVKRTALQTVAEQAKNDGTKAKASEALKAI